jgi:hypothetical protein
MGIVGLQLGHGQKRGRWFRARGRSLSLGLVSTALALVSPSLEVARAAEAKVWHDLPDNTALVMLLDTTADTWGQLDQYQLFSLLNEEIDYTPGLPGLPYLPYGLNYQTEVAPWIGDTAVVALLPAEPDAFAATVDHMVMVAPVAELEAFANFRSTLLELQGEADAVDTVLGTEIYVWSAPEPEEWIDDWPEQEEDLEEECDPAACDGEEVGLGLRPDSSQRRALRFTSGMALPLTVQPLQDEGEALEVEVPVPLPEFSGGGLAIAFLPDALVAAETPAALEQYLRLRQDEAQPSLTESLEFQRTLTNQQSSRALVAIYGNALELLNFNPAAADLPSAPLPLPIPLPPFPTVNGDTLRSLRSLNFGGTLEALVYPLETGMQARGRYYYDAVPFTFGLTPTVADADSPLTLLPASTYLMMSGRNVAGLWRGMSRILDSASDFTREGLASVRSFFTLSTGLDLDEDVFGWMDGEVAIAAFPAEGGPLPYAGLGLLLQTSDRPTAENTLTVLDELLPSFGLTANPRTVNQQPVTSWELRFNGTDDDYRPRLSVGSHSWVTADMLAVTSGTVPMASVLAPSPHDPLADFFLFDQATAAFPRPNNGYFYLNAGATLALAYQVFELHDDPAFEATKPFLGSIRSLSATSAQTPNYIEVQGQLGLAPHRE